MLKQVALAAALLTAPFQTQAGTPSKQPKHLLIDVTCGGYELWYQNGSVWGVHGSCGPPNVIEAE